MGAYRVRCADCHGMAARGFRGPEITQVWARGRSDSRLFASIRSGVPSTEMPAFPAPRMSDLDAWRILAYLKTLTASAPGLAVGNASAGQRIFATNGTGCHCEGDRGGHLGPDLSRIASASASAHAAMARQIRGHMTDFRMGYAPVILTTPDGQHMRGVKKHEGLLSVQVMDTRERIRRCLREDMRTVADETQSAMPTFGPERWTDAQLDDLLA